MKQKAFRRVLTVILALVFVCSAAVILQHFHDRRQAVESHENALQIAIPDAAPVEEPETEASDDPFRTSVLPQERPAVTMPDEELPLAIAPEKPAAPIMPEAVRSLRTLDLEALRQINSDVLGWIHLPDTVISYPLVDSHDNAEYLNLTWDKQKSRSGSIFLERKSSTDLSDFHTLIYGHNWQDGIMFSPLLQYADQEFADSHSNLYLITDEAILQYKVFSAYTADVVSNTYRLYFEDDARRQECIEFWKEKSVITSDVTPEVTDRVLTLSTCTGRGVDGIRWVVHTVLTEVYPR